MKNGAKSPIFLFENPKTCPKTCQTSYKKISFEKSALGRKVQRVRQQTWSPLIVHQALNFHFMDFGPHILTFPIMPLANCIQSPSTFDICTFWSPTSHFCTLLILFHFLLPCSPSIGGVLPSKAKYTIMNRNLLVFINISSI